MADKNNNGVNDAFEVIAGGLAGSVAGNLLTGGSPLGSAIGGLIGTASTANRINNTPNSNVDPTTKVIDDFRTDFRRNNYIDSIRFFNPYRFQAREEPLVKGIPIIFITTPKLNLSKEVNLNKIGFFKYMRDVEPDLLKLLNFGSSASEDVLFTGSPFIKILTNNFKNMSLSDVQMRTKETNETFYGYKQLFPSSMIDSITANEITINYVEDKNLDVIKLHKAWTDYIEYARRGLIKPSESTITSRTIDFTCSIYYFLLDFDFETILYYSKYTGCAPINVPYNVLAAEATSGNRDIIELPITYVYSYKEDMNPDILMDFNIIAGSAGKLTSEDYVKKIMYSSKVKADVYQGDVFADEDYSKTQAVAVSLENYNDNDKKRYKLKFLIDYPPASSNYNEYSSTDLTDPNSEASIRMKEIQARLNEINKQMALNLLNPLGVPMNVQLSAEKVKLIAERNVLIGNHVANEIKENATSFAEDAGSFVGDKFEMLKNQLGIKD